MPCGFDIRAVLATALRGLSLLALTLAVILAGRAGTASAKGYRFSVLPNRGELGSTVTFSGYRNPDVTVTVSAGLSDAPDHEPKTFSAPLAVTRSDASGTWSVHVTVQSSVLLRIPRAPGWVVFRAESPGSSEIAAFAVTVDGQGPDGAGEIDLTMTTVGGSRDELASLSWQPAGGVPTSEGPRYFLGTVGPISLLQPFAWTIGRLTDGDWDLLVVPLNLQPEADAPARSLTVQATLCGFASGPCPARPGPLTVTRVPVRDGRVVNVHITLRVIPAPITPRAPTDAGAAPHGLAPPALPSSGDGATADDRGGVGLAGVLALGGFCLVAVAARLRGADR